MPTSAGWSWGAQSGHRDAVARGGGAGDQCASAAEGGRLEALCLRAEIRLWARLGSELGLPVGSSGVFCLAVCPAVDGQYGRLAVVARGQNPPRSCPPNKEPERPESPALRPYPGPMTASVFRNRNLRSPTRKPQSIASPKPIPWTPALRASARRSGRHADHRDRRC